MDRRLGLVFVLAGLSSQATAQLTPVAQDRSVSASGHVFVSETSISDSQSDAAADFGPFHSTRGVNLALGASTLVAQAQQDSQIAPTTVSMSGLADVAAFSGGLGQGANGDASSHFELTFDLAQNDMWDLDAKVTGMAGGDAFGNAFLQLTDGVNMIAELNSDSGSELHITLSLLAGEYILTGEADASASAAAGPATSTGHSTIDFTFQQVPEPGAAVLWIAAVLLPIRGRR